MGSHDLMRQGSAIEGCARTFVDDDHIRVGTHRPSIALVEILERLRIHEEQGVAEPLHTGLQAERRRGYRVIAVGMAVLRQHTLTALSAEDEPGFHDLRNTKSRPPFGQGLRRDSQWYLAAVAPRSHPD